MVFDSNVGLLRPFRILDHAIHINWIQKRGLQKLVGFQLLLLLLLCCCFFSSVVVLCCLFLVSVFR